MGEDTGTRTAGPYAERRLGQSDADAARGMAVLLSRRWVPAILVGLQARPLRRARLAARLGAPVSEKVLTETLKTLERHGLVIRTVHTGVPPVVVYRLTPAGRSLLDLVEQLAGWTLKQMPHAESPKGAAGTNTDSRMSRQERERTAQPSTTSCVEP